MGIITGIEKIRHTIVLSLDNRQFARMNEDELASLGFALGGDVDEDELADRLCALQFKRALEAALNALERRDLTREGMRRLLEQKDFYGGAVDTALDRLTEGGLIDDRRFAERFVELNKGGVRSKRALRDKLYVKGVPRDIIDEALSEIDDDEQLGAAVQLAREFARRHEGKPEREVRAKVGQALARRGFSWDDVSSALERVLGDGEDFED